MKDYCTKQANTYCKFLSYFSFHPYIMLFRQDLFDNNTLALKGYPVIIISSIIIIVIIIIIITIIIIIIVAITKCSNLIGS